MKKPLLVSSSLLAGLCVCLAASNASAQDSTSPPPAAPMNTPPPASSSSMGGGTIGIGAVTWLGTAGLPNEPVAGGQFVYDMSAFHLEGVFGFSHTSVTGGSSSDVRFGVAGWYHLAKGTNADFSIGGGAGLAYASAGIGPANGSATGFTLEPGAEARVFLSPNFALSARVGFAITFGDNSAPTIFSLGGQTTSELGFTYFFR